MRKTSSSWILAGVLGFGVPAMVVPNTTYAADRVGRDRDVEIRWDDVPRDAQDTILRECSNRKIHHVYDVVRDGKQFYRAVVVLPNGDQRMIRVMASGRLLSVQEFAQADLARYKDDPARMYREYSDRDWKREHRWDDELSRVTATAQHPDIISWEQVPPRVRVTFMRESGGVKPDQIIRYRERDNILFQTNIPTGGGRVHMLQVLPNGDIYNEGDFNERGRVENRDWRPRTISYSDMPGRVKDVVDREARRSRIVHVDEARRPGGDIYTVQIDEPGDTDRYLTIRDDGKILSDITDSDRR